MVQGGFATRVSVLPCVVSGFRLIDCNREVTFTVSNTAPEAPKP